MFVVLWRRKTGDRRTGVEPHQPLRLGIGAFSRAGIIQPRELPRGASFPEREILIDILPKIMILSRSVNIMARRNLTTAEIGDIVRTTRKAAGLRQDELAGAAGVGLRFIVDLEAGKPTAQIGKTLQVLAALGCSLDITPPPDPKGARKG
jgi:y4mF family transcriptional regulator